MNINSPLTLKPQLTLKNRVIVPPMASATANERGQVTTKTLEHYQRLSSSRASLVMVEYSFVHLTGKSEPNQLGLDSDEQLPGLKKLAEVIHSSGAASAIQLTHAGAKTSQDQTGGRLISPSGMAVPVKGTTLETPILADLEDIKLIKESFLNAALRAHEAGFQIIELHAAHGYGLNQWLSPITNQRNDQYGGSMQNRARILMEIIRAIKIVLPQIVLSVRMPGMDHFDGGLAYDQTIYLAKKLEKTGVAIINVSSGLGGWRRPGPRSGEGYLVSDAAIISKEVSIPVIGVGGIKTAKYINDCLRQEYFSLAAVGRSILNDPSWGPQIGLL